MVNASLSWPQMLEHLQGGTLTEGDASALMEAWLAEELTPVQTGGFLAALRARGVDGTELGAMAQVLRKACPLPGARPELFMVDTCGTGGDGADTFNISTAVAFTAAACGAVVAKHGNRSASGKVGSADVLEGLGLQLKAPASKVVEVLSNTQVTFLFAPAWHPALVNLAPLRRSLGVRTVFNLLGPLVNPLQPNGQVLGWRGQTCSTPWRKLCAALAKSALWWCMDLAAWMKRPWLVPMTSASLKGVRCA